MSDTGSGDSPPELKSNQSWRPDAADESDSGDQRVSPEIEPMAADEEIAQNASRGGLASQPDSGDDAMPKEIRADQHSLEPGIDEPEASTPETAESLDGSVERGEQGLSGSSDIDTTVEVDHSNQEPEPGQPANAGQMDQHAPLPREDGAAPSDQVATENHEDDGSELMDGPAAGAPKASWASRIGLGRFLGKQTTSPSDDSPDLSGAESVDATAGESTDGLSSRLEGFRGFLDPRLHMQSDVLHSRYLGAASAIALVLLMANNAGLALIVASTIVPVLIVMTLVQHDVFEKESQLYVAGTAGAGVVAGVIVGWLSSVILRDQWFGAGQVNFGAGGFGGRFAEEAGSAPVLVLLICGLVLPAIGIAGIGSVPIILRRWPQFRNEVMDGLIMAGASAAGLSIGLSIVMWYPMVTGYGPQTQVSDWTLMLIGSLLLRPIVFTLCGAMIGAGVWRYMFKGSNSLALVPAIGGIVGVFLLTAGSILWQPSGVWIEFLWTATVAVVVFAAYRRVLEQAIATDTQALGDEGERTPCPSCSRLTPVGRFCAYCGAPLAGEADENNEENGSATPESPVNPDPLP